MTVSASTVTVFPSRSVQTMPLAHPALAQVHIHNGACLLHGLLQSEDDLQNVLVHMTGVFLHPQHIGPQRRAAGKFRMVVQHIPPRWQAVLLPPAAPGMDGAVQVEQQFPLIRVGNP